MKHFSITQASATALLVMIIGQVAAFVPAVAHDQQILISAGTSVITSVFLLANAIHAIAGSKITAATKVGLTHPPSYKPGP